MNIDLNTEVKFTYEEIRNFPNNSDLAEYIRSKFMKEQKKLNFLNLVDKKSNFIENAIKEEFISMDIYALPGHLVKCFTLSAGYEHEQDIAKKYLKVDDVYTVKRTEVYNWSTSVYLEEFPGISFNSVFFKDFSKQSTKLDETHGDYKKNN